MTDFFRACFDIWVTGRLGILSGLPGIKYFAAVGLAFLLAARAYRNREPGGRKPDPQGRKPDPQGVAELPRNAIAFFAGRNRPAKKLFGANNTATNTATKALHKRYNLRYKNTKNVTPESRFFNAAAKSLTLKAESLNLKAESLNLKAESLTLKALPSLPPPFPPYDLLFSPVSLPKKNNLKTAAAAATATQPEKKREWERLLDEICPPGNIALREIRGFIARGMAEELVIEVVRETVLSGARFPKYVIAVPERHEVQDIKTVAGFRSDAQKKNKMRKAALFLTMPKCRDEPEQRSGEKDHTEEKNF